MTKINIKGQEYLVVYVDRVDSDDNDGECDRVKKKIKIKKSLGEAERQATLIHELFHAVLAEVCVSELISVDLEEIIVENLSTYIIRFLKELCEKEKQANKKKRSK